MSKPAMETETQVLEFSLEEKRYCVDIGHVDEIVDKDDLTQLPNTPSHVEGVMDLRGTTTTIVNPKVVLEVGGEATGDRVIVFESTDEERTVGWVIDEVDQVVRVDTDDLDDSVEGESVEGVIRSDDGFVVWVDPTTINAKT